ncbi:MAG: dienelactone hydrolase family protein, partial [Methyloligellaceae bacterium]
MPSSDITYNTRTGESFSGILTQPEGEGDLPSIVLVTAIFGIDDEMIELAEAYAADGYLVSVPDYFWRQTPGPTADREVAFARMNKYDREQGINDIEDVITDLRSHPRCNGKIAVL